MRRLKTVRRPPIYPNGAHHLPCSSLTHPAAILTPSIGVLRWIRVYVPRASEACFRGEPQSSGSAAQGSASPTSICQCLAMALGWETAPPAATALETLGCLRTTPPARATPAGWWETSPALPQWFLWPINVHGNLCRGGSRHLIFSAHSALSGGIISSGQRTKVKLWGTEMQIVRVYSGSDGESHFEELTVDQFAEIANNVGLGDVTVNRMESPSFVDYHTVPRRQYLVNLSGIAEFETADGSVRRLVPGDVLVAEDLTGHGHIARSIGDEFRVVLAVPLAD